MLRPCRGHRVNRHGRDNTAEIHENRKKNREFSGLGPKIVDLCPKSANFLEKQGISRQSENLDAVRIFFHSL
jgi:hypothetical protein